MDASRESDGPIVPKKRANKAGSTAAAEPVEGRGTTKGNAARTLLAPDTGPGKRGIGLCGVREVAKRDKKVGITHRKVNWVLDADIRGFFDNIDHEWLWRFLEHRIADRRILRLIRTWLRAGVSEDEGNKGVGSNPVRHKICAF
jgi:hypothetical protein